MSGNRYTHVYGPIPGVVVEAAFRALGLHRHVNLDECNNVQIDPRGVTVTESRKYVFGMGGSVRLAGRVTEFGIRWGGDFAQDTPENRMEVLRAFARMAGFELTEWQEFVAQWARDADEGGECVCASTGMSVLNCPMHGPDAALSQ